MPCDSFCMYLSAVSVIHSYNTFFSFYLSRLPLWSPATHALSFLLWQGHSRLPNLQILALFQHSLTWYLWVFDPVIHIFLLENFLLRVCSLLVFSLPSSMLPESLLFALISDSLSGFPRAEAYLFPIMHVPFWASFIHSSGLYTHPLCSSVSNPARVLIPSPCISNSVIYEDHKLNMYLWCFLPFSLLPLLILIYTLYLTNN